MPPILGKPFAILTASAGTAMLALATPAVAANLEYGQEYEAAFLDACGATAAAPVCQCAMEGIEAEMTFETFANAVARNGGNLSTVAWWSTIVAAQLELCRHAPIRLVRDVPDQVAGTVDNECMATPRTAAELGRAARIEN